MKVLGCVFAAALLTCTDGSGVAAFRQSDCIGSVTELEQRSRRERIEVEGGQGLVRVAYRDAHFRCEQRVAAHASVHGNAIDVVVQPADMNPRTVAKCDCLYDITFEVPRLVPTTYEVTVARRWDERHGAGEAVRIGSASVVVR